MVFNSLEFACFFAIVLFVYFLLQRSLLLQNRFLLVASSVFYGWWDWRFLFLMYFTIVVDFIIGKLLSATNEIGKRKLLLVISISVNLTILGVFKYLGFFVNSAVDLITLLGFQVDPFVLNIVLPVGISFYTFQSMSYVVDIYRKNLTPAKNLLDYATYVSLFPQLVAGPIERGTHLLPQILKKRQMSWASMNEGMYLILWGLFKKVFIADNLAKLVNPVFANTSGFTGAEVLIATYAFAFQIYCDFSGYSDIARGTAKCLGFDLMLNFKLPYFAKNPSDFWQRWHISLSTWLRDYLYITLGGNRKSNTRTYVNLMLTMVIGGLWHGAHWNYVLWGGYQGALLVIHRAIASKLAFIEKLKLPKTIVDIVTIVLFFQLVCIGWLIFRATSIEQIVNMTHAVIQGVNLSELVSGLPRLVFFTFPLIVVQCVQYFTNNLNAFFQSPIYIRVPFYVGLFYAILMFGNFSSTEFIYFQF